MNFNNRIQPICILILLMALLASGCAGPSQPKELAKIVATPRGNVALVGAFVTHNPMLLSNGTPLPNILPPDLKKIYLGLRFKNLGSDVDRFKVDYKITYKGLVVDAALDSEPTSWKEQSSGANVLILPIRKKDGSAFASGEYDGELLIDGKVVAVLHWRIGGGED